MEPFQPGCSDKACLNPKSALSAETKHYSVLSSQLMKWAQRRQAETLMHVHVTEIHVA